MAASYRPLSHVNWHPSSYDPTSHLMFDCATDQIGALLARPGNTAPDYVPYEHTDTFGITGIPRRGILVAANLTIHKVAWQQQWGDRCFSGSTVTAGGRLFIGRNDGRLTALNSSTDDLLWSFHTDTGIHQSPTVFEHNGKQHVAVFVGGTLYAPNTAGDSIWVFSLKGELEEFNPEQAGNNQLTGAQLLATLPTGSADLDAGRLLYTQSCTPSHGASGEGGEGGGVTLKKLTSIETLLPTLSYGRNNMPPFQSVLTPAQVKDVGSYVMEVLNRERRKSGVSHQNFRTTPAQRGILWHLTGQVKPVLPSCPAGYTRTISARML